MVYLLVILIFVFIPIQLELSSLRSNILTYVTKGTVTMIKTTYVAIAISNDTCLHSMLLRIGSGKLFIDMISEGLLIRTYQLKNNPIYA